MMNLTSINNCRSGKNELSWNLTLVYHGTHGIPKNRSILPFIYKARCLTHQQ